MLVLRARSGALWGTARLQSTQGRTECSRWWGTVASLRLLNLGPLRAATRPGSGPADLNAMPQPAAAALLTPFQAPAAPGPGVEEAAQRSSQLQALQGCLQAEAARAAADLRAAETHTAAARQALQQGCSAAQQQHEHIAAALAGLAARLGCLAPAGAGAPSPLLSLDLPDSYARSCTQLLDLLAGYVQHHIDTGSGAGSVGGAAPAAAEQQQHRRRALELEQLQSGACKAGRLRVEEEAEEARWELCRRP